MAVSASLVLKRAAKGLVSWGALQKVRNENSREGKFFLPLEPDALNDGSASQSLRSEKASSQKIQKKGKSFAFQPMENNLFGSLELPVKTSGSGSSSSSSTVTHFGAIKRLSLVVTETQPAIREIQHCPLYEFSL